MTELEKAANSIIEAWSNPGLMPRIHKQAQIDLQKQWPVLATAIENLVTIQALQSPTPEQPQV